MIKFNAIFVLLVLSVALTCQAQESADEDMPEVDLEQLSGGDTDELELDPLEVTSEGWSFEQEVSLRMIRQAYEKPKSTKQEAKDDLVCWTQKATGSHLSYLGCARNGDLWALKRDFDLASRPVGDAGYGRIMVSTHPVNRWKLERSLETLKGDEAFDQEFTLMVQGGQRPSRDIPDDAELDQFITAYRSMNRLAKEGADEDRQIASITDTGLTLDRYNRIVDLLEEFGSLKNKVGERLKAPAGKTVENDASG